MDRRCGGGGRFGDVDITRWLAWFVAQVEAAAARVDFSFPQPESSGQRVATLRGVDFAYGDHAVTTLSIESRAVSRAGSGREGGESSAWHGACVVC